LLSLSNTEVAMYRTRHALLVFIALTGLGCSGSGSLSAEEATDLVMRDVGDTDAHTLSRTVVASA